MLSLATKTHTSCDAPQIYSDADGIKMLEYLIDNIFVEFGGRIFQQTIGKPMGTNCAPLLADLFLHLYEAEFVQSLLKAGKKHLAQQFNFTYRYVDEVLPLKNTKFAEYLEFIYPRELEIKETTETAASSSNLDCYLYIDSGKCNASTDVVSYIFNDIEIIQHVKQRLYPSN